MSCAMLFLACTHEPLATVEVDCVVSSLATQDFIKVIGKGAFGIVELWQQRFSDEKLLDSLCSCLCTRPPLD